MSQPAICVVGSLNIDTTYGVRQLPGANNFMGTVKFVFPNAQGIYLHDTPDKHLLGEDARQLSSGCVRLEPSDRCLTALLGILGPDDPLDGAQHPAPGPSPEPPLPPKR